MNENLSQTTAATPAKSGFAKASWTLGLISVGFSVLTILLFILLLEAHDQDAVILYVVFLFTAFFAGGAAVICAWCAGWQIKKSGGAVGGKRLARTGSILGYISVAVFLASANLPNFMKARTVASKNACVNNLRQFAGAKEQWGLENKKTDTDTPTFDDLIGMDKYFKVTPVCPAGGTYTLGNLATKPKCSVGGPGHTLE